MAYENQDFDGFISWYYRQQVDYGIFMVGI